MKNNMLIRTEVQQNGYTDLASLLMDVELDKIINYYLVVNDEEIQITSTMATSMAAFFDEYNEVHKIFGA